MVFFHFFHSIIGLVVKFPLAMREPRVRYDTLLRFLTIVPNDAISFSFLQPAVESSLSLSNVRDDTAAVCHQALFEMHLQCRTLLSRYPLPYKNGRCLSTLMTEGPSWASWLNELITIESFLVGLILTLTLTLPNPNLVLCSNVRIKTNCCSRFVSSRIAT